MSRARKSKQLLATQTYLDWLKALDKLVTLIQKAGEAIQSAF